MALAIEGEEKITVDIETVWKALNDIEILKVCIPGCEELEKTSDRDMKAKVTLKIGPIKATFAGEVTLSNWNPPHSYTITGSGKGGIAGFAKGGADVSLVAESDTVTVLKYVSKVDVGGKIAQLGGRLILSTSKKLTEQFFAKFNSVVSGAEALESTAG